MELTKATDLKHLEWMTPQVLEAMENAYRRGYFHGASNCYGYVARKRSMNLLSDWIDNKIQNWLYWGDTTKKELPPTP